MTSCSNEYYRDIAEVSYIPANRKSISPGKHNIKKYDRIAFEFIFGDTHSVTAIVYNSSPLAILYHIDVSFVYHFPFISVIQLKAPNITVLSNLIVLQ